MVRRLPYQNGRNSSVVFFVGVGDCLFFQVICKKVITTDRILPCCFVSSSDYIVISHLENLLNTFTLIRLPSARKTPQFLGFELCGLTSVYTVAWVTGARSGLLHRAWWPGVPQGSSAKLVGTLQISRINVDPSEQIHWSLFHLHITFEVQNN